MDEHPNRADVDVVVPDAFRDAVVDALLVFRDTLKWKSEEIAQKIIQRTYMNC